MLFRSVLSSLTLDSISRHPDYVRFASTFSPLAHASAREVRLTASLGALALGRELPFSRRTSPHASCHRNWKKYRTIDRFPIDYAFPPRLRGRLTRGRLPLPRKPYVFGGRGSHPSFRYLCLHSLYRFLQNSSRIFLLQLTVCSPTTLYLCIRSVASV